MFVVWQVGTWDIQFDAILLGGTGAPLPEASDLLSWSTSLWDFHRF